MTFRESNSDLLTAASKPDYANLRLKYVTISLKASVATSSRLNSPAFQHKSVRLIRVNFELKIFARLAQRSCIGIDLRNWGWGGLGRHE